jgi:hypothetical protein
VGVSGRRFAALAVVLVAVNVFFWLAQSGFALPGGGILQQLLGDRLIRAEVVWQTPSGIQDTRIDRGVVVSVTQDQIVLREKDGSTDAIPLAPNATVTPGRGRGKGAQLRRGLRVLVSRSANGPADSIEVEGG